MVHIYIIVIYKTRNNETFAPLSFHSLHIYLSLHDDIIYKGPQIIILLLLPKIGHGNVCRFVGVDSPQVYVHLFRQLQAHFIIAQTLSLLYTTDKDDAGSANYKDSQSKEAQLYQSLNG